MLIVALSFYVLEWSFIQIVLPQNLIVSGIHLLLVTSTILIQYLQIRGQPPVINIPSKGVFHLKEMLGICCADPHRQWFGSSGPVGDWELVNMWKKTRSFPHGNNICP